MQGGFCNRNLIQLLIDDSHKGKGVMHRRHRIPAHEIQEHPCGVCAPVSFRVISPSMFRVGLSVAASCLLAGNVTALAFPCSDTFLPMLLIDWSKVLCSIGQQLHVSLGKSQECTMLMWHIPGRHTCTDWYSCSVRAVQAIYCLHPRTLHSVDSIIIIFTNVHA